MGKKLVIKDADFSANCVVIPFTMQVNPNKSITLFGIEYTGGINGTRYEIETVPTLLGSVVENYDSLNSVRYGTDVVFDTYAFASQVALKRITLMGLSKISYGCFLNCQGLEVINGLENSIKDGIVDSYGVLFGSCYALKSVDISSLVIDANIVYIDTMFSECHSLETVKFGNGFVLRSSLITGATQFFKNCYKLTLVDISAINDVTTISGFKTLIGQSANVGRDSSSILLRCYGGVSWTTTDGGATWTEGIWS